MSGLSFDAGPILDYASPRQRGRARLPSRSRFAVRYERDGLVVHEWLEAKASAYLAMAIGVFTFAALMAATFAPKYPARSDTRWFTIGVPAIIGAIEIVVFMLAVNDTWRQTKLEAGALQ